MSFWHWLVLSLRYDKKHSVVKEICTDSHRPFLKFQTKLILSLYIITLSYDRKHIIPNFFVSKNEGEKKIIEIKDYFVLILFIDIIVCLKDFLFFLEKGQVVFVHLIFHQQIPSINKHMHIQYGSILVEFMYNTIVNQSVSNEELITSTVKSLAELNCWYILRNHVWEVFNMILNFLLQKLIRITLLSEWIILLIFVFVSFSLLTSFLYIYTIDFLSLFEFYFAKLNFYRFQTNI